MLFEEELSFDSSLDLEVYCPTSLFADSYSDLSVRRYLSVINAGTSKFAVDHTENRCSQISPYQQL
jgi:hypothetical protein